MLSDAEIANSAVLRPIGEIAQKLGYTEKDIECFGHYKAKVPPQKSEKMGKLVLVTAMNPTPFGEGKTTISIGLADALSQMGERVCLALREPSLGPVFGIKGGACGGGYAQVVPMEDINLHFTGDFHAITSANNLLSALIDNHIHQGNALKIREVIWKRCMDMNDRALREVEVALGGKANGVPRTDGFTITAASEIMAILCLSTSLSDLKRRLDRIVVGYDEEGKEVTAQMLNAAESMTVLLKEAMKPNLVQTLEGTPALVHGGPFANIAHGCNSVLATETALSLADYAITEAGFGAELGAEKFLDIKCRVTGLAPSCVVLDVTCRSVKYNGGVAKADISKENLEALTAGFENVKRHVKNLRNFGQKTVVAINRFPTDTDAELATLKKLCEDCRVQAVICTCFAEGSRGAMELASAVASLAAGGENPVHFTYDDTDDIEDKIAHIVKKIYYAGKVEFTETALSHLKALAQNPDYAKYPVCIAKTQYSFSCDEKLLGAPEGHTFVVQDIVPRAGAGFLVVIGGKMLLMPGLPASPNTERIHIDCETGVVTGLM